MFYFQKIESYGENIQLGQKLVCENLIFTLCNNFKWTKQKDNI